MFSSSGFVFVVSTMLYDVYRLVHAVLASWLLQHVLLHDHCRGLDMPHVLDLLAAVEHLADLAQDEFRGA